MYARYIAGLTVLAASGWSVPAFAQNPYFRAGQAVGQGQGAAFGAAVANPFGVSPFGFSPWNMYGGYGNSFGGTLSGAGDVINAQSQYMVSAQQANLTKQQVKSAKLDNQRKAFDQWLYERDRTPTREDERERDRIEQLRRSLGDPPVTEIWSAKALNEILLDVQQKHARNVRGPEVPLEEEQIRRINVSTGTTTGSIGPLKNGGKLSWPLLLKNEDFQEDRDKFTKLAPEAMQQAAAGTIEADTLNGMIDTLDKLQTSLKRKIKDVPSNQYIAAKRYLNELNDSMKVLQDPDASRFVTQKLSARGNTVGDLVDQMTKQGLKFAPATSGDQSAYTALHSAMLTYDIGQTQFMVSAPRQPMNK